MSQDPAFALLCEIRFREMRGDAGTEYLSRLYAEMERRKTTRKG